MFFTRIRFTDFFQLFLLLTWVVHSTLAQGYCAGTAICVYGFSDGKGNINFTVHSSASGWASVGVGSQMAGSICYVAWRNTSGGIVLSVRTPTGRDMPDVSTTASRPILSSNHLVPPPPWAKLSFSFSRPAREGANSITASSTFIWGHSLTGRPSNPNSPSSSFPEHSTFGTITGFDFTKLQQTGVTPTATNEDVAAPIWSLPPGKRYEDVVIVHAVLLILAWAFFAPLAIICARFLKGLLGIWWFRLHIALFVLGTGVFTIAGITHLFLYKNPPHFQDIHEMGGLLLAMLMIVQYIVGIISDRMFDPNRTEIPLIDKMHWWLGRFLFLLAVAVSIMGFILYKEHFNKFPVLLASLYAVCLGGFFIGPVIYLQMKVGVVHHVDGDFKAEH